MTIHVPVDEFKARLAEVLAAARRGEEVIIIEEGADPVKLVAAPAAAPPAGREHVFGIWRDAFAGYDTSLAALKSDHEDPDERFRRKFGLSD